MHEKGYNFSEFFHSNVFQFSLNSWKMQKNTISWASFFHNTYRKEWTMGVRFEWQVLFTIFELNLQRDCMRWIMDNLTLISSETALFSKLTFQLYCYQ